MNHTRTRLVAALSGVAVLAVGASPAAADRAPAASEDRGPISIWYSNNQQEIDWAVERIDAWNADHPDEEVSAQEIPAGESSEEVIAASITAGNTPCLIYNTAPAAVPSFQRQQGLVALDEFDDGRQFIEDRLGDAAAQYQSADGQYYQMPWKANPVMLLYNKTAFEEAGLDPEDPPLRTHEEFLDTARTLVESGAVDVAVYPAPTSQFFQSWFDFYPWFAAETGGTLLVEDGAPTFDDAAGLEVAGVWRQLYEEGLAAPEPYQGDAFADGVSAINSAGPWAVAVYDDVDWGVVPPPTSAGADEVYSFSDAKSVGMYVTCDNRQTAWDFLKFTMSEESDRALLETTGQLPMRTGVTELYADWFEDNANYLPFAEQLARVIEVPNVPNSVEVWQTFRDAWVASVIFGDEDVESALSSAAEDIEQLVNE